MRESQRVRQFVSYGVCRMRDTSFPFGTSNCNTQAMRIPEKQPQKLILTFHFS